MTTLTSSSKYAYYASLAYNQPGETNPEWVDRVTRELADDGWAVRCFTTGDCEAYVAHRDNQVIVAFRGTEGDNLTDFLTDARGLTKKDIRCSVRVHGGAYQSLMQVWPDMLPHILDVAQGREVDLVGHSLGGMLASIAGILLNDEPIKLGHLVTFGAPPAGNRGAAGFICGCFPGRTLRFVHCSDWVPRIRIQWLLGYRHYNGLRYIDRNGVQWCSPSRGYQMLDRCLAQCRHIWGWLRGREMWPVRSIQDHDLERQYRRLV